jgi:hypothetical protein
MAFKEERKSNGRHGKGEDFQKIITKKSSFTKKIMMKWRVR